MNNKEFFYLFACNIPVKGYSRSLIMDVQREEIYFIPNALYQILMECQKKTVIEIKEYYNNSIVDDYFDFLISKELGIYVESLKEFPPIDLVFTSPNVISNAIIEISKDSLFDFDDIINQLTELNCEAMELRFLDKVDIHELSLILDSTTESTFRSITVILPYDNDYSTNVELIGLHNKYPRVCNILIYNCDFCRSISIEDKLYISYNKQKQIISNCCGNISPSYFSINLNMICESVFYNNCLNKKLSITSSGLIKNCPSMAKSFGDITKDLLRDVVESDSFKELWHVKKDDIMICKDCEMRYICGDCRVHITDSTNIYSKPSKCTYNPYTCEWNEGR